MTRNLDRTVLLLVVATLIYLVLAFGGVRLMDQAVALLAVGAALILFAFGLVVRQEGLKGAGIAGWLLLAFLVYGLVRHFAADTEYESRREILDLLMAGAVFLLVVNTIRTARDLRWVVAILLVVGTALSFYAAYQFFAKVDQVWFSARSAAYTGRGSGTYINPNHLAGYLEMVLPLGIALTVSRVSWTARILAGYAVFAMVAGVGFTISRGGWLSAAVGLSVLVCWLAFARRMSRWWLLVLVVIVVSGGAVLAGTLEIRDRLELTKREIEAGGRSTRRLIWKAAWDEWQSNPWWGSGPNQFGHRYYAHRDPWLQTNPVRVHNDYLNTLSDYGLVGFGLVILFAGCLLGGGACDLVRAGTGGASAPVLLLGGALAGLTALAVHSVFDFNLHIRANLVLAALLAGMVVSCRRQWRNDQEEREGRAKMGWLRVTPVAILLVSMAALLIWQGQLTLREARWLGKARASQWGSEESIASLLAAAEIEPGNPVTLFKIGEHYRQRSMLGEDGYEAHAEIAMKWFERLERATPASPWPPMKTGMCLHWLGRHDEAGPYFEEMIRRDPNSYRTRGMMGWHYFQLEDYASAREWFVRARSTPHFDDPVTRSYFEILQRSNN